MPCLDYVLEYICCQNQASFTGCGKTPFQGLCNGIARTSARHSSFADNCDRLAHTIYRRIHDDKNIHGGMHIGRIQPSTSALIGARRTPVSSQKPSKIPVPPPPSPPGPSFPTCPLSKSQ